MWQNIRGFPGVSPVGSGSFSAGREEGNSKPINNLSSVFPQSKEL
jgi:hypothetical protein